ncbi:MAG: carbohydrate ABC transporter permease [Enterocloster sp.]
MMITLLAGLQSVPAELYEAAEMDGAGFRHTLTGITLPLIKPISFISTILTFLWTFNTFENIWLLTGGGPNGYTYTLPILSYYTAFLRQNISYASAIAVVMILVLLLISLVYFRVQFREKERG